MSELLEKIHPQVFRIPTPFANGEVELYLLMGDRPVLLDTGVVESISKYVAPALEALGLKVSDIGTVIITHAHPDHLGGNYAMREASEARIMLHEADIPLASGPEVFLNSRFDISELLRLAGRPDQLANRRTFLLQNVGPAAGVDVTLKDGDLIELGQGIALKVIHTPGHTPGSVCLYWEKEGILFTGDAVQGRGGRPGWMPLYFEAADYLRSVERLASLPVSTICLAHGYQTGGPFNVPVRRQAEARRTLEESAEVSRLIDRASSQAVTTGGVPTPVDLARAALALLQQDLPVCLDRTYGVPLHSISCITSHARLYGWQA